MEFCIGRGVSDHVIDYGYPRPQLERASWTSLNGIWDFALDPDARWQSPDALEWTSQIVVPFAPETAASGVGHRGFFKACWYRRVCDVPPAESAGRLLLHFGAVDYATTVWVNGRLVGRHHGGYTPFSCDITDAAGEDVATIVVRAFDDPEDLEKPRGKQDWQLDPHSIWYPRTSGIWQTVWLERVPRTWIDRLHWTPTLDRWDIGLAAWLEGQIAEPMTLAVQLSAAGRVLVDDQYLVTGGEVHRRMALSDPGIDDFRNELLWSPERPTIIDARLRLLDRTGAIVDEVASYTALRAFSVDEDHFILNGRPYPLRLVLDQGYWPESGATPPNDDALRRDVELARAMGFNGVRKHQKIEVPRYLYWADRLGLLVWEEMPSAYRFTAVSIERTTQEWMRVICRDWSHPSIVAWVPFNESWGVPNLPTIAAERHYVRALYFLTKTLDPTRPVVGNDGWESVATDIIGIHDYSSEPQHLLDRYHGLDSGAHPHFFRRERPGGRALVLESEFKLEHPLVLSECGGIACPARGDTWGYSVAESPEMLIARYEDLMAALHRIRIFAGFCYTQFADTYQEANGLLYADRTPKCPIDRIARATRGQRWP